TAGESQPRRGGSEGFLRWYSSTMRLACNIRPSTIASTTRLKTVFRLILNLLGVRRAARGENARRTTACLSWALPGALVGSVLQPSHSPPAFRTDHDRRRLCPDQVPVLRHQDDSGNGGTASQGATRGDGQGRARRLP